MLSGGRRPCGGGLHFGSQRPLARSSSRRHLLLQRHAGRPQAPAQPAGPFSDTSLHLSALYLEVTTAPVLSIVAWAYKVAPFFYLTPLPQFLLGRVTLWFRVLCFALSSQQVHQLMKHDKSYLFRKPVQECALTLLPAHHRAATRCCCPLHMLLSNFACVRNCFFVG